MEKIVSLLKFNNKDLKEETINIYKQNTEKILTLLDNNNSVLINGSVQSGKTNNLIYLSSKIVEKYNLEVIIYFTGKLNSINNQNYDRFEKIFENIPEYIILKGGNLEKLNLSLYKNKVLIINAIKDPKKLKNLIMELEDKEARFLVIFDEGDESTLSDRQFSYFKKLKNSNNFNKLITITASPYENFTKKFSNFYDKNFNLEIPSTYSSISDFKYIEVNDNGEETIPEDVLKRVVLDWASTNKNSSKSELLINVDVKNEIHDKIAKKINNLIEDIIDFDNRVDEKTKEFLDDVKFNNGIKKYNKDNKIDLDSDLHQIIIGGINLSRGITFKNLTHEIIFVKSKIKAATLLQRARWCGYRKNPSASDIKIYTNELGRIAFEELIDLERWTKTYNIEENSYETLFAEKNYKALKLRN